MDVIDYIKSGILQDYCLGLLSAAEKEEVEAICHAYPEIDQELQSLRLAIERYAADGSVLRRSELKKAIWDAIKDLREDNP